MAESDAISGKALQSMYDSPLLVRKICIASIIIAEKWFSFIFLFFIGI